MHRSIAFVLLLLLALMVPAGVALASDPNDVADQVDPRGYYIEPGAEVDFAVMEGLVAQVTNPETRFYFVALADDPVEGTDEFAEKVVVPAGTTGATTTDGSAAGGGSRGGSGGVFIFLAIVVGVIALVFYMTRRSATQARQTAGLRLNSTRLRAWRSWSACRINSTRLAGSSRRPKQLWRAVRSHPNRPTVPTRVSSTRPTGPVSRRRKSRRLPERRWSVCAGSAPS